VEKQIVPGLEKIASSALVIEESKPVNEESKPVKDESKRKSKGRKGSIDREGGGEVEKQAVPESEKIASSALVIEESKPVEDELKRK
jgi:hypothetical protein